MENTNDKIFGRLFNNFDLHSEEHLELIIHNMDINSSKYFLVEAIKYAYNKNIYTIGETEVISKAIRTLTKDPI